MTSPRSTSTASKRQTTYRYLGIIAFMIALIVSSSFLGFTYRTDSLLNSLLLEEARAFNKEVTLLRSWVREQGGVYIRQGGSGSTNPAALSTGDGDRLTHLNASEMTRELSELSHRSGIVRFGSTALSPLNPANQPDAFEQQGLMRLRDGEKEVFGFEHTEDGLVFRYMSPLKTRKGCLTCHADGSFQPGRVDSGLSFTIPADGIARDKHLNKLWMALSSLMITAIASLSIWWLARRFTRYLDDADKRLEKMASQDNLTGLMNRTMGMDLLNAELSRAQRSGRSLCVAIIDIDYFKRINDSRGHLVGDEALRSFAGLLQGSVRDYDITFRYGGEEFVLVMPDTETKDAMVVAERLRAAVEELVTKTSSGELSMTVSIGVGQSQAEMKVEELLDNADKALYRAKESGRNRIVATDFRSRQTDEPESAEIVNGAVFCSNEQS